MPNYFVLLEKQATLGVEVEADTPEEAMEYAEAEADWGYEAVEASEIDEEGYHD